MATAQSIDSALVDVPACSATELPRNDDGSSGLVPLGFTADFYGEEFSSLFVNNNGNVTFDSRLATYTPFPLSSVTRQIIAPFFGDVDTRGIGSDVLRYGYGNIVFEDRPAFCATWKDVGYYSSGTDKLNSFQLILVDRSDRGAGDFDIVFNYDKIQWEAGSASGGSGGLGGSPARAGFSNGSGLPGTSYELPGSGLAGALLDSSPTGLRTRSLGSSVPGRLIFTVTSGQPNVGANGDPEFDDWHAGDLHAHAAGDTHLGIHPQCEDLTELTCAFRLIDNTYERAARFGTEWLIFTEHMPWLGFQKDGDIVYKFEQAEEQWETIRTMVGAASTSEIRGLLGAELGTAVPACTRVSADVTWSRHPLSPIPTPTWGGVNWDSPGHYGVYYTPNPINDSIFDCDETGENGYVDDVEEAGGFGGINHPDNDDGGSPWWCYSSERNGDGNLQGAQHQPQVGRFERCNIGIDQYGAETPYDDGAFRSIELISGNNMPSRKALGTFDMFLQNGYRIAAVGGGDGHTAPRKQSALDGAKCVANPFNGLGECIDKGSSPGDPNHNKTGGSGRTLTYYEASPSTGAGYSATAENDPVRVAIRNGETVATNGPKAIAQIDGQHPGQLASLAGDGQTELRIDWSDEWKWSGDILEGDDLRNFTNIPEADFLNLPTETNPMLNTSDQLTTTTPSKIVIVTAERDGCGWDQGTCSAQTSRQTFDVAADGTVTTFFDADLDVDPEANTATVLIDPPVDGYVRVELYWEDDLSEKSTPDFVAVTSPIYVEQNGAPASIGGTVRDQHSDVVAGALVELCRTTPARQCVTRLTGSDGTFAPLPSAAGTWAQRTFPPAGRSDLGVSTADLGYIGQGTSRTVNITLPGTPTEWPYIDPSGVVLDTFGQPIENATVTLLHSDDISGPFVPVDDGSPIMSPANRANPDITNELGEFRWDVLAGWFKVSATSPGCVSEFGADAAETPALQVPPPALNLVLVLDCRVPDDQPPVIEVDGPDFTNADDVTFTVTLTGESDYALATCLVDGGPTVDSDGHVEGDFPECGDQFTAAGLEEGVHTLGVLAFDDHQNMSIADIEFTVDRTPPSITVSGVEPGATYSTYDIPTPVCDADDELSGLDGPCVSVLTPAAGVTGAWTYTANALDRAGNTREVVVSFIVEQDPVALWSSSAELALSVRGSAGIDGIVHSEGDVDLRGNVDVTGGVEHVGVFYARGHGTIDPSARAVDAGVIAQQLRDLALWADTGGADGVAAAADACSTGTWNPTPLDLSVDEVIAVPCNVEIRGWKKGTVVEATLVVDGSIMVASSDVTFLSDDRPSLIAAGPTAAIDIRGNNVTATGLVSDGPISISGNRLLLTDPMRPSLVATSPDAIIDVNTSNSAFHGGVLSASGFSLNGGNNEFGCGIYAATITLGGGNSSIVSCPQR